MQLLKNFKDNKRLKNAKIPYGAVFCKFCIKSLIGGNVKRQREISETDLRMILEARLDEFPDGVIRILGKQGDPLTLARIPARKQSNEPLGPRQIKNIATRMREIQNIVLVDPAERKKRRELEIKLDPKEWQEAFSKSGPIVRIPLEKQDDLIRALQQNNFSDAQIRNLEKLHKNILVQKNFTHVRRSITEISSRKREQLKNEIQTGVEEIQLIRKHDKIERKINWWRVGNVKEVLQNWINAKARHLFFHTSQPKDKIRLAFTSDHFGEMWGFYAVLLNTLQPNSPNNSICLILFPTRKTTRQL